MTNIEIIEKIKEYLLKNHFHIDWWAFGEDMAVIDSIKLEKFILSLVKND